MSGLNKILVANRGEIALRIIRACRELHIATVAVYSDADRGSPHVRAADEAIYLGSSPALESYLNQEKILAAARRAGADAVHPGYGFFAENPHFAEACRQQGLVFIGPSPQAIARMASKSAAKELVRGLGVPVIPSYHGEDQSAGRLRQAAAEIGYPVLIKAAFGGGGKGMRVVTKEQDLLSALASAQQEARSAFGNEAVLVEKYLRRSRHVEVQVVADRHGNLVHCFERECSVQRRHQKIIEEAPSRFVSASLRTRLTKAALEITRAVDYEGVGTVEFMVEDLPGTESFYFLEMNTRLQVEHGITELVTGLDLVKVQLEIAEGRALPFTQDDLALRGHAIECRLYAEDPGEQFLPATGTLRHWRPAEEGGVRVDAGVAEGMRITPDYDPLLAKVLAWGEDRERAVRALTRSLERTSLLGVTTNQRFLLGVLRHPLFLAGGADTGFVEAHLGELAAPLAGHQLLEIALIAALFRAHRRQPSEARLPAPPRDYPMLVGGIRYPIRLTRLGAGEYEAVCHDIRHRLEILAEQGNTLLVALDGQARTYLCHLEGDEVLIHAQHLGNVAARSHSRFATAARRENAGSYRAAMPGRILEVRVEAGQPVQAGDKLVVMESMKMEHGTIALEDGVVTGLFVRAGDAVDAGAVLIAIEPLAAGKLLSAAGE